MSTRTKLLLSILACVLALVLVLTAKPDYRPFSKLTADSIFAIEADVGLGIILHSEDEDLLDAFAEKLSALMLSAYADAEGSPLATIWVMREDGSEYELVLYESHVILDGTSCRADPAIIAALYDLALLCE